MSGEQAIAGSLVNKTAVLDQTVTSNDLELFGNASKTKTPGLTYKGDFGLEQTQGIESGCIEREVGADLSATLQ